MTRAVSFRLLFSVIPEHFFCHSERSEESSVDAALSATGTLTSPQPSPSQKERDIFAIPSASEESTHGCFTTLSMTGWGQQSSPSGPSPSQGEGRFGESQNRVRSHGLPSTFLSFRAFSFVIPNALSCHSEPERGIQCVDASLCSA